MDKISNTANDPFEEFEFRPINEGLGFHRKQKTASGSTTSFTTMTPAAPAPARTRTVGTSTSFSAPLPRTTPSATQNTRPSFQVPTIEDDSIAVAQTAVNEILKNLNQKRQMDFLNETEKQKLELKKSKPFFLAATLDGMLIMAAFLMSMIIMLTVTKIDLFLNLGHAETSRFVYIATIALFFSITFIYMVVNRAFLGYTPGEWAFDQRCGDEAQMAALSYIPRLGLRAALVMVSGFVVLPVLSYLFNKDIAGYMTGVNLFRKPNV